MRSGGRREKGSAVTIRGVVFDYSGTLSRGAVLFASPGRLMEELRRSGLEDIGVGTPAVFWDRVVNPTWEEASTTPIGYRAAVTRRVSEILGLEASSVAPSVSRFADAYFTASKIDPEWTPLLTMLAGAVSAKTIVASDHYAEATDSIIGHLARMGIRAAGVRGAGRPAPGPPFLIANSADIGFHKATQRYWEAVKGALLPERLERLLIVDDFGANEQPGDSYADMRKVESRRVETVGIAERVFGVKVEVFPFILPARDADGVADDGSYRELVGEASGCVTRFISDNP
jgi:hypothetical protein